MKKLFLNMVMLPKPLWQGMGADIDQLKAILDVRLTLDDRKPMGIGRQQQKQKNINYGTALSVFIFSVMGCMYMFPLMAINDRIAGLTFYFSMLLGALTLMLITDFSNVLFDARDKFILFPRPVNDRTMVLARMLHVFIYLFRITIPLGLGGWVYLGIVDGWKSALLFPLVLTLMLFMALFFVNSVYLLILRLAKPEKFKDVINYFQVITSVVFFASMYLMPRMFDSDHPRVTNLANHPWARMVPSYWLADCWTWIGFHAPLPGSALWTSLAVVFPLFCVYALVRWLSPQFSRRIAGIDGIALAEPVPANITTKATKSKFYQKLSNLFNSSDDAKAGFQITWLQTSRSRSFRMRVYPTFAYIPVYFVYMLSSGKHSFMENIQRMSNGKMQLFLLYMSSFALISALSYLTMSDQYKAAWVYYSAPLEKPGRVMIGAFKAIWIKYFLPFFLFLSAFTLYTSGSKLSSVADILLAFANTTLFVSCVARIGYRHLPFSVMEQTKQSGARILKTMLVMIIPTILGLGHFLAFNLLWLKLIFLVLAVILLWLVWDSYANTTWENMIKSEVE